MSQLESSHTRGGAAGGAGGEGGGGVGGGGDGGGAGGGGATHRQTQLNTESQVIGDSMFVFHM